MRGVEGLCKLFVGNLNESIQTAQLRALFEQYGTVIECDVVKNYAFVHMANRDEGREAIESLNGYNLNGNVLIVEMSKSRHIPKTIATTKIFVGNLASEMRICRLRDLFAKYGTVIECDIVRNYGFVHLDSNGDVYGALRDLNGYILNGKPLNVQLSTSRIRQKPGMGDLEKCYRCGNAGHWSKECPRLAYDYDREREICLRLCSENYPFSNKSQETIMRDRNYAGRNDVPFLEQDRYDTARAFYDRVIERQNMLNFQPSSWSQCNAMPMRLTQPPNDFNSYKWTRGGGFEAKFSTRIPPAIRNRNFLNRFGNVAFDYEPMSGHRYAPY